LGKRCVVCKTSVQPQAARLSHRDRMALSKLLDRRCLQPQAASCRAVRLCQHQRDGKTCCKNPFERRTSEFRRTGKKNIHIILVREDAVAGRQRGRNAALRQTASR